MTNEKIITFYNLQHYHNKISQIIDNKQDIISDLSEYAKKSDIPLLDDYAMLEDIPSIEYCTTEDILRLFDTNIPDAPIEPDTPVVPEENIGSISDDNSIVIDETRLENGTYTLRYIDNNDNIIDNFNEITSFEINN